MELTENLMTELFQILSSDNPNDPRALHIFMLLKYRGWGLSQISFDNDGMSISIEETYRFIGDDDEQ